MSDENLDKALENLDEIITNRDLDNVEADEMTEYADVGSYERSGSTEYELADEITNDFPELLEVGDEIYTSASALQHYRFEGELPEGTDIILKSEGLGAGKGRRLEEELDQLPYNVKVQGHVNPTGLRRII